MDTGSNEFISKKHREFSIRADKDSIHEPSIPAEIRPTEPISASILFNNSLQQTRVWKISPFGVELVMGSTKALEAGEIFEINIDLVSDKIILKGIYNTTYFVNSETIACFKIITEENDKTSRQDRRAPRWRCASEYRPTAHTECAVNYRDVIHFRIVEMSDSGVKAITSLRNKFIFPGMNINASVAFPVAGQISMNFKIEHVYVHNSVENKPELGIDMSYHQDKLNDQYVIANYLLRFADVQSYADIKKYGFITNNLSSSIDFSYVETEEEYRQVLALRRIANTSKLSEGTRDLDLSDEYDSRSRICIGKHKGKVVCTVRLTFHEMTDLMEIEKHCDLPDSMPDREKIVEGMRLCTHPDYRASDLLFQFLRQVAIVVSQSNRNYFILSCVENLIPFYKKLGLVNTGLTYESEVFKGTKEHVFIGRLETMLYGININPVVWNAVYGDLFEHLNSKNIHNYTMTQLLRVQALKLLKPLATFLTNRKIKYRSVKQVS